MGEPSTVVKTVQAGMVAEAAELGRKLAVAQQTPQRASGVLDAVPYIVLRKADGTEEPIALERHLEPPHRKTGAVKLNDAESFILYYGVHGNGAPVYATMKPAKFVAVLNEHTKDAAGWRDHRADFTVKHSAEWDTWMNHNGSGAAFNSNDSFAVFLEDNAPDIVEPSPADMLAMALNFRVNESVAYSKAIRLQDGHTELVYDNLVSADGGNDLGNGRISIPETFCIKVPVFDGMTATQYEMHARFRFRLTSGKLSIWYELIRPHKVIEQAFRDLWKQIGEKTGAPILHGTPD